METEWGTRRITWAYVGLGPGSPVCYRVRCGDETMGGNQ